MSPETSDCAFIFTQFGFLVPTYLALQDLQDENDDPETFDPLEEW